MNLKRYNSFLPALGKMKVRDVEHRHIAKFHHSLRETPYAANRTFAVISKFFAWAERNGYRQRGTNPAIGIEKYKEEKRTTFMGADELARIGSAIPEGRVASA
ncbi:hypothetical protein LJC26_04795 [Desulfovibrio sp. OttesenSCG-928-O18]|nr:hypothetical protein [Desulfovibrio sp. OttesenSCG-928-O18]